MRFFRKRRRPPVPRGRKVVIMLTLKELRSIVEEAKIEERVPSVRALLESGSPIVVKEILSGQTEISVYQNGRVLYRVGNRATVFPLHPCGDYIYDSAMAHIENIKADFFEGTFGNLPGSIIDNISKYTSILCKYTFNLNRIRYF